LTNQIDVGRVEDFSDLHLSGTCKSRKDIIINGCIALLRICYVSWIMIMFLPLPFPSVIHPGGRQVKKQNVTKRLMLMMIK